MHFPCKTGANAFEIFSLSRWCVLEMINIMCYVGLFDNCRIGVFLQDYTQDDCIPLVPSQHCQLKSTKVDKTIRHIVKQ